MDRPRRIFRICTHGQLQRLSCRHRYHLFLCGYLKAALHHHIEAYKSLIVSVRDLTSIICLLVSDRSIYRQYVFIFFLKFVIRIVITPSLIPLVGNFSLRGRSAYCQVYLFSWAKRNNGGRFHSIGEAALYCQLNIGNLFIDTIRHLTLIFSKFSNLRYLIGRTCCVIQLPIFLVLILFIIFIIIARYPLIPLVSPLSIIIGRRSRHRQCFLLSQINCGRTVIIQCNGIFDFDLKSDFYGISSFIRYNAFVIRIPQYVFSLISGPIGSFNIQPLVVFFIPLLPLIRYFFTGRCRYR